MDTTPKTKVFRQLAKPKHAEMYSLEECAKFQPWQVDLKIEVCAGGHEPLDYTIYLRAQSPDDAQWTAYHAFCIWEGKQGGESTYPVIYEGIPSVAWKMTEQQYKNAWKEAHRYPHRSTGDRRNPSIFRYVTPDWTELVKKVTTRNTSIIKPSMADISRVTSSKVRK